MEGKQRVTIRRAGADDVSGWELRTVTSTTIEEARRRMEDGDSVDGVLGFLRSAGASPIDSILVLRAFYGLSARQAQYVLHSSEAWPELWDKR